MNAIKVLLEKCDENPLILCAISALGFSTQALFVKFLSIADFPSFEIIIVRGFCQFSGVFIVLCCKRTPITHWLGSSKLEYSVLFGRGLFGFGGIAFGFYALNLTSLANAQVAQQTIPVWTAILGKLVLGEPFRCAEMLTTLTTAVGVCLIFRPPFLFGDNESDDLSIGDNNDIDNTDDDISGPLSANSLGILWSLIGSACAACAYCCIRVLGTSVKVPWPSVMLAQALSQMCYSVPTLYLVGESWQVPNLNQLLYLLGCGFLGFSAQVCMTIGMQKSHAASASLVRQTGIVYSFIFDAIAVPSDSLSLSTIGGALIIVIPISILGYIRSTEKKAEESTDKSPKSIELSHPQDGGKAEEASTALPSAETSLSDDANQDDEEDEEEEEVGKEEQSVLRGSDAEDSFAAEEKKKKKTKKKVKAPLSKKKDGGKYVTLPRVASDEDVCDGVSAMDTLQGVSSDDDNEEDESKESLDKLPAFGFRWNSQASSTSSPQSWESLTHSNWNDEHDGVAGWDTWEAQDSPQTPATVINSVQTSLRSTTNSVLQLVPPSIMFKKGRQGGERSEVTAYRGLSPNDIDSPIHQTPAREARDLPFRSSDIEIADAEALDDEDIDFGV